MQTICDQGCKKEFKINKFRVVKMKDGVERTGFRCPHCKHDYVSFYTNRETRKLHKAGKHKEAAVKMDELKRRMVVDGGV